MSKSEIQPVEQQPKAVALPTDIEKLLWNITLFLAVSTVVTTLMRML